MTARLQAHVHRRAARFFARCFERDYFRVVAPIVLVKTFADNLAVAHHHAAHHRIRAGQTNAFARKRQRVLQEANVVFVHGFNQRGS